MARLSLRVLATLCAAIPSSVGACLLARDLTGYAGPALSEGGLDSGALPDAPGPFCASLSPPPTFCRDFDDGRALSEAFELQEPSSGRIDIDDRRSTSSPSSLSVTVPAHPEQDYAFLYRQFPDPAGDIAVAFDVLLEEGMSSDDPYPYNDTPYFRIAVEVAGAVQDVLLLVSPAHSLAEERYKTSPTAETQYKTMAFTTGQPRLGTWSHMEVHTMVTPSPQLVIKVDGQTTVSETLHSTWGVAPPKVQIGIPFVPDTKKGSRWSIRYDNLVVDIH